MIELDGAHYEELKQAIIETKDVSGATIEATPVLDCEVVVVVVTMSLVPTAIGHPLA